MECKRNWMQWNAMSLSYWSWMQEELDAVECNVIELLELDAVDLDAVDCIQWNAMSLSYWNWS